MIIHTYLLCYNEEYIIESVLRYYTSFSSKVFILDNFSTDRSCEIARKFKNVTIIKWHSNNEINESLYVKMKSQTYKDYSRKGGKFTTEVADWVISADMDEVLYSPNLIEDLRFYKKNNITVPQITGFNIVSENDINKNFSIISQYKNGYRIPDFDKRIIFDVDFDISYSKGCHPAGHGFEYMKETFKYKASNERPLALLHFKHIGERYIRELKKNASRLSSETIEKKLDGSAYINRLEKIKENGYNIPKNELVIDDNMNVLFEKFPPTTGEIGTAIKRDMKKELISLILKETYQQNIEVSIKMLELAKKINPNGPIINKRIKELKEEKN